MEDDFQARHHLDEITLLALFAWDEPYFLNKLEGSPIRRIGFQSWQRNIAVALGNAPFDVNIINVLEEKRASASAMVDEHISWAIAQQQSKNISGNAQDNRQTSNNATMRLNARLIRSVEKGLPRDA